MATLTPNKDQKRLVKALVDQGFEVSKARTHIKVVNPETKAQISIPSTPRGGTRTWLNMLKTLKRIGFDDTVLRQQRKPKGSSPEEELPFDGEDD